MNLPYVSAQIQGFRATVFFVTAYLMYPVSTYADAPYLTGVIEDGDSQTIEMPNLPYTFRSQVEWLAPEGSHVDKGDIVVRIHPGGLIEQAEVLETAYEEQLVSAETSQAEHTLWIIDAETALEVAKTNRDIAWLDAQVPASAVTELIHDRAQLALENAENALRLAEEALANAERKFDELKPVLEVRVRQAEASQLQVREALNRLTIRAERAGIVIYAENEFGGMKIFAGESLMPGQTIATIASGEQPQFVFWVHDADINYLKEGQRLSVVADALPDKVIEAEVDWIANYASERETWSQGGYFKLIAKPISATPSSFIPGMAVSAEAL